MPATSQHLTIDPSGLAVVVDILDSYGTSITVLEVTKIATNTWVLSGDVAAS